MKKLNLLELCPLGIFLAIFGLFLIQNINHTSFIDLHSIQYSDSILFEIESIQEKEDSFLVNGKCFDSSNTTEYDNWITGKGVNSYQNIQIVVYDELKAYKMKTYSTYDSLQVFTENHEVESSLFTFSVSIPKKFEGYKIGVVSKKKDGSLSKVLSERKICSE